MASRAVHLREISRSDVAARTREGDRAPAVGHGLPHGVGCCRIYREVGMAEHRGRSPPSVRMALQADSGIARAARILDGNPDPGVVRDYPILGLGVAGVAAALGEVDARVLEARLRGLRGVALLAGREVHTAAARK